MNRHEQREKAMIAVYQYLLMERDIDELIADAYGNELEEIDPYFIDVIHDSINKKDEWIGYINHVLDHWEFDRLGTIEQAILLNGCSEFDQKKIEAAIIIDESVEMAKKYCEEDTYKLINRVLDVI